MLSSLVSYYKGKFFSSLTKVDITRIYHFLIIFILPPILMNSKFIDSKKYKNLFFKSVLIFTLLVGFSLLTSGLGHSLFIGGIFAPTTVSLTMVSIIAYFGLYQYYVHNQRLGLVLSLIAWLISIASLAKWNFFIDITIPILIVLIYFKRKRVQHTKKIIVALLFSLFLAIGIVPRMGKYFNSFASLQGYSSFDNYLDSRVLRQSMGNVEFSSGAVFDVNGVGISDGARISMWNDMIDRTLEHPFFGLGLGARPFDYYGSTVEDHSFLIYTISRFGFVFGFLILFYVFKAIKFFYDKYANIKDFNFLKYIYLALIGNFFFQGSVGQVWGQLPVTLLLGLILGVMLGESMKYQLNYEKQSKN